MPITYHKRFTVTGVINTTTFDGGIQSTEAEPRNIKAINISVSAYQGNILEIWVEREKLQEHYDYVLNTHAAAGAADAYPSTNKMLRIPVDVELKIGDTMKVAITCGGTATNIFGSYEYELRG
jgi:hypothetical protein